MSIFLFILILFVLVLVHELGHFLVAKKTGMRVDEFGIGFPPRLFGVRKGETEYTFNALPIGGFVKIYGEDLEDVSQDSDNSRAFGRRPVLAQVAVLIAGVSMNILFAWLLFVIAFSVGTESAVSEEEAGKEARLAVLSVLPQSPAERAGLTIGDTITHVTNTAGDVPEELSPSKVSNFIAAHGTVAITILRDEVTRTEMLTAESGLIKDDTERKVLGVTMGFLERSRMPIHTAFYEATVYTATSIKAVALGIFTLAYDAVRFQADFESVAGPVGIAGLVDDAASIGFTSLLMFTAFISLNLAVINILPFPALDGGRLLLVFIEVLKGSPIAPRIAYGLNAIGFILLMLLMVAVTYSDIAKIIAS